MGGLIDINTLKLVLNRKSQSMVLFITRVKVKFSTFNEIEFFFFFNWKESFYCQPSVYDLSIKWIHFIWIRGRNYKIRFVTSSKNQNKLKFTFNSYVVKILEFEES